MQVIDTITLPFCTITIAEVPEKVTSLDELPDFLLPIKWKATSIDGASKPGDPVQQEELDAHLAIHFSDVKNDVLKGNQNDTVKEKFLKSPGVELMENSILYALQVMETRKKVRQYLARGNAQLARTFDVVPFHTKSRQALAQSALSKTKVSPHTVSLVPNPDGTVQERVILHLGASVVLTTRPHSLSAPLAGEIRFRGVIGMLDGVQNFSISRIVMPTIFKQFVTEDVLQEAYRRAVAEIEQSAIGLALRLPSSIDFVSDDEDMYSTYQKDE